MADEEGNDWLHTVAAGIIATHNNFIEGVYSSVRAQPSSPLARFLPDEPEMVYPSEVNDSNCIVGKLRRWANIACRKLKEILFQEHEYSIHPSVLYILITPCSLHGISDFLQLVRSRYHLPSIDSPMEPQDHRIPGLLQLTLLQEDIVSYFLAGKPLICTESSSPLRIPFKFRQPPRTATEAGHVAEWVGYMYHGLR